MTTTMPRLPSRLVAEVLGTFALVFMGTGAVVTEQVHPGTVTHVGIGLIFGLIVMAMAYTFGDVSGAHLNPGVTLSFAVARRFPWREVLPYVLAQCVGAIAASGLLRALFPDVENLGVTRPDGPWWASFVLEVVLTFVLVMTILRVSTGAKEKGIMAGAAVGAVVALEAIFAGKISGASMNPARSLGPALVGGDFAALWIYWTAPLLGAVLAVPTCALWEPRTRPSDPEPPFKG